jgi:hypothetical protein
MFISPLVYELDAGRDYTLPRSLLSFTRWEDNDFRVHPLNLRPSVIPVFSGVTRQGAAH